MSMVPILILLLNIKVWFLQSLSIWLIEEEKDGQILPWSTLAHSPGLHWQTPLVYTGTLPWSTLAHSPGLHWHTPLVYTGTLPWSTLAHSPGLHWHTPLVYTGTLPWPTLAHSPGLHWHTPLVYTGTLSPLLLELELFIMFHYKIALLH